MRTWWYIEQRAGEKWRNVSRLFGTWVMENGGPDVLQSFGWSEGDSVVIEKPAMRFVCFEFPKHHGEEKIQLVEAWVKTTDRAYGYFENGEIHFMRAELPPLPYRRDGDTTD